MVDQILEFCLSARRSVSCLQRAYNRLYMLCSSMLLSNARVSCNGRVSSSPTTPPPCGWKRDNQSGGGPLSPTGQAPDSFFGFSEGTEGQSAGWVQWSGHVSVLASWLGHRHQTDRRSRGSGIARRRSRAACGSRRWCAAWVWSGLAPVRAERTGGRCPRRVPSEAINVGWPWSGWAN